MTFPNTLQSGNNIILAKNGIFRKKADSSRQQTMRLNADFQAGADLLQLWLVVDRFLEETEALRTATIQNQPQKYDFASVFLRGLIML